MNITNYNKTFTDKQIEDLINLLPSKYRNLDIDIIFPKNKYHCLKWLYLKHYKYNIKQIFNKTLVGSSCTYYPKVFIYIFNYDVNGEYKLIEIMRCVRTLYHEIRHQWQRHNNLIKFKKYNSNDSYKNKIKYEQQWHEIDAKGFAKHIMNLNHNKIREIVKINL